MGFKTFSYESQRVSPNLIYKPVTSVVFKRRQNKSCVDQEMIDANENF